MLKFADSEMNPVDSANAARLSRILATAPALRGGGIAYSNSPQTIPKSGAVLATGKISPTTGIQSTGNAFSFTVQGNLGFAWLNNALTIYWDGTNGSTLITIKRADGTSISIPKGRTTLTSLQPGTQYGFAPFIAVAQAQTVSFSLGDVGSPRYAFSPTASPDLIATASQTQRLSSNEALTQGLIYFTTGTSGTPATGSGGNGGGSDPYTGSSRDPRYSGGNFTA